MHNCFGCFEDEMVGHVYSAENPGSRLLYSLQYSEQGAVRRVIEQVDVSLRRPYTPGTF